MQTERGKPIQTGSALATLDLNAIELAALAKQGFVCAEDRGEGRVYCKLRVRVNNKQRVWYLGKQSEFVDGVRCELQKLQEGARLHRELGRLVRTAKHRIRAAKHQLQPLLEDAGYAFHGLSVRQPRLTGRRQSVLTEPVLEEENHEGSTGS